MVEVSVTVGKLDASLALLLTNDHHLIEFPTILLPDGVVAGSVVKIRCERDLELETKEKTQFKQIQDEILDLFGTNEPKAPVLKTRNVTQTSCVLEWDPLDLGSANIKSLTLFKNKSRLGQIPNPLATTTTKLSGLPIDTPYEFFLRLKTTAGVYDSNVIEIQTHKMTDLSGITVCLGEIDPSEGITREAIEQCLQNMGAKPLQDEVKVDTTHFICTKGIGQQWKKAIDNNIPIVRPEWLKASETERRIIGVRNFYLDADPSILQQHRFVRNGPAPKERIEEPETNTAENDGPASGSAEVPEETQETETQDSEAQDSEAQEPETQQAASDTAVAAQDDAEAASPKDEVTETEAVPETLETIIDDTKKEKETNGNHNDYTEPNSKEPKEDEHEGTSEEASTEPKPESESEVNAVQEKFDDVNLNDDAETGATTTNENGEDEEEENGEEIDSAEKTTPEQVESNDNVTSTATSENKSNKSKSKKKKNKKNK